MISILRKFGPGLLFAGAAIGVSHLVQSTRAGADYGLGLIWALILVNLFKYPFFEYGPRYTAATGESLLKGYYRLGPVYLKLYFILSLVSMFTIQTAVTIVTAGIAVSVFGDLSLFGLSNLGVTPTELWTVIVLAICIIILLIGKYKALDRFIKLIIVVLTVSTFLAVISASSQYRGGWNFEPFWPKDYTDILFLIAFMGWMPAPIDVSIFHSIWAEEKAQLTKDFKVKEALFDFNLGYIATVVIGLLFLALGFLTMYESNATFGKTALEFSNQLMVMYTKPLGGWAYSIIAVAALTAMFSTTITTLDASPRAVSKSLDLIQGQPSKFNYRFWLLFLSLGTVLIFVFLASEMTLLIKIATVLSFITAPFYAALNFKLVSSTYMPKKYRPKNWLKILSWSGLVFLVAFSCMYLVSLI